MSNNERVNELLEYGWTIAREDLEDGEIALRICELPNFVVAGSEAEVSDQFWDALKGYLQVAIKYDHPLPVAASGGAPGVLVELPKSASPTFNKGQYDPPRHMAEQLWGDLLPA